MIGKCELCEREKELTFHHLIPKSQHARNYFKKTYTRIFMSTNGLYLCEDCHNNIHTFFSEKDIGKHYYTKVLLLSSDKVRNFLKWIKKQA